MIRACVFAANFLDSFWCSSAVDSSSIMGETYHEPEELLDYEEEEEAAPDAVAAKAAGETVKK